MDVQKINSPKILTWIFLGPRTKKAAKADDFLRVAIVNILSLLGTFYLVLLATLAIVKESYPFSYSVAGYISAFILVSAFIAIHTKKGMSRFNFAKLVVVLNIMILYGLIYCANIFYGEIWTFLLPTVFILLMGFRLGLVFCSVYFLFMMFTEFAFAAHSWEVFVRFSFLFWGQAIMISAYETLRVSYSNRLFKEKEFAKNLVSTGRAHYQKLEEMYKKLSVLRHDFKYHAKAASELQLEDDLHYYCSNSVINALLSSYAKSCKELKINYDVQIALPKPLSMPSYDMCIILGNLLENALEACKKLDEGGEIKLSVKANGSHLAIMVKNSFDGTVSKKNGKLESTKKNGGFGLPSIQAVIDSRNGYILTEWSEREFTVYVTA